MSHQQDTNTVTRLVVAVAVGFFLFQVLAVDLVGILAAVAIPREYFAWFGKERQELALALLQLACAFPVFLLVCGGVLATTYVIKARPSTLLVALFVGMLLCFSFWAGSSLVEPGDLPPGVEPYAFETRFKQIFLLPWWAYPVALSPWLGFGFAVWLLLPRSKR